MLFYQALIRSLNSYPAFALAQGQKEGQQKKLHDAAAGGGARAGATSVSDHPVSHWRSRLTVNIVGDHFLFDREYLPNDVHRYLRV